VRRSVPFYRGVVWMFVCFDYFVISVRGLCDGLIPCTEESYGCMSFVIVVFFQVEVCATGWSIVQGSPMDICVF